jgi:hypothetical protein
MAYENLKTWIKQFDTELTKWGNAVTRANSINNDGRYDISKSQRLNISSLAVKLRIALQADGISEPTIREVMSKYGKLNLLTSKDGSSIIRNGRIFIGVIKALIPPGQ